MPASIKHLTDKKLNLTSLLARWKDGLYYTAAIVRCDRLNKRCLVCFEDGSEVWIQNRDVHVQLTLDQLGDDEDIVCCVCDEGHSEPPNEIILCDVCQQGYHQSCHLPPVDSSKIDEAEESSAHKDWFCATCSYILNQSTTAGDHQPPAAVAAAAKLPSAAPAGGAHKQTPAATSTRQPAAERGFQLSSTPATTARGDRRHTLDTQLQSSSPTTRQKPKSKPHSPQPAAQTTRRAAAAAAAAAATSSAPHLTAANSSPTPPPPPPPPPPATTNTKTTIGPLKTPLAAPIQKAAPYYPLSTQARTSATTSATTAAFASMTASSALVVGSSAGRTKQDLVNQGNRSSQKSSSRLLALGDPEAPPTPPVKHAVRKSGVNFALPVQQSALPIATRSVIPNIVPPVKPGAQQQAPSPTRTEAAVGGTTAAAALLATTTNTTPPVNPQPKVSNAATTTTDKPPVTSNLPTVITTTTTITTTTSSSPKPLPTIPKTNNSNTATPASDSTQQTIAPAKVAEEKVASNSSSSNNGSSDGNKSGDISQF